MIRTFKIDIDDSLRGAEEDIDELERTWGAEEVKTGHWEYTSDCGRRCDCGYVDYSFHKFNYCPNCGSRMEEKE